jgi:hypothetical protein
MSAGNTHVHTARWLIFARHYTPYRTDLTNIRLVRVYQTWIDVIPPMFFSGTPCTFYLTITS